MLNQLVLVGRLVQDPEVKELEDGKKVTNITVAIPRAFKNAEGSYDTDFIDCVLWNGIAEHTSDYCHKGDVIGIKGRLQNLEYEKEDGTKVYKSQVVAERVTFLSAKKERDPLYNETEKEKSEEELEK